MVTSPHVSYSIFQIVCIFWVAGGVTVNVSHITGKNDFNCLHGKSPCKSLDFISERDCSELTVILEDEQFPIFGKLSFENCTTLSIRGRTNSSTTVWCDQKGGGFLFKNVTGLHLSNWEIDSCGYDIGFIKFGSKVEMHIHQSAHVTLTSIIFVNSSHTALVMSDTLMQVTIANSKFLNNNPQEDKTKKTFFPSGVHIQFSTNSHHMKGNFNYTDSRDGEKG